LRTLARRSLWLTAPYFAPDAQLLVALKTAAAASTCG
jgi:phosphatidylserine/phosphatidylglycerophosphate/cardiolipin synthase-like enzyme